MKMLTRTLLLTGIMTLLPLQASAEKVYESVGPSGEVIFSDRKPAGAVEVKELEMGKRLFQTAIAPTWII